MKNLGTSLIGAAIVLALPSAIKERSWRRLLPAALLSLAVVELPLTSFILSSFSGPKWGADDWLDCFIFGKLALTPPALLATAALYSLEVLRVEKRTAKWIVLGIFLGATIAVICFVYGLAYGDADWWNGYWLVVPLYMAVWYTMRALQLVKEPGLALAYYVGSLIVSLPFWVASWVASDLDYDSMHPTGCFVVTAASRGHERFVGPFSEIRRRGRIVRANRQLVVFWQLEAWWRRRAPRSHRLARRVYNRVGPVVARRVSSRWRADLVWVALKPLEWVAGVILECEGLPMVWVFSRPGGTRDVGGRFRR